MIAPDHPTVSQPLEVAGDSPAPVKDELSPAGFSALLGAAADAIVIIDSRGSILNFNAAAQELFQYSADDVVGSNVKVLMPDPYHSRHDAYLDHYINTGEARVIGIGRRVVARRSDGQCFPIELSVGEYHAGEVRYFIGIIRDLSEQERLMQELRESREDLLKREQALEVTLNNAPIGIITADLNGIILSVNHAATQFIGYRESVMVGQSCAEFIHPDDVDLIHSMSADLASGRHSSFSQDVRLVNVGGRVFNVVMHCACVRNAYGEPESLVAQLVDVTEQLKAEKEAAKIRERFAHVDRISTMGEMASGISHEINQPLAAISSYVQACLRRLDGDDADIDRLRQILLKADDQAQRAGDIVRRIRSLIRSQERVRERTNLQETIADAIRLVSADARGRGVGLMFSNSGAPCEVIADRIQLQQVVLNLVRNAIDAMEATAKPRGSVEVSLVLDTDKENAIVSVRDYGVGLSEEVRDNLFESFVTSKSSGTGLGLSISRTIVEAHGGEIWHEPANPGARFLFTIPLAVSPYE